MNEYMVFETVDGKRTCIGKATASSAQEAFTLWLRIFGGDPATLTFIRRI